MDGCVFCVLGNEWNFDGIGMCSCYWEKQAFCSFSYDWDRFVEFLPNMIRFGENLFVLSILDMCYSCSKFWIRLGKIWKRSYWFSISAF